METQLHQEVCTKTAVIDKLCLSSSVLMGSCVGVSPSHHRSRYISWCVDSAETPAPGSAALSASAAPGHSSHKDHQPAGSGSIPLVLLSPPETSGGETNAAFSHHSQLNTHSSHADEGKKSFLLRRSSPVIFRRHRPVSWNGAVSWNGGGADRPAPSSSSSSDSLPPAPGSLSPGERRGLTVTSLEELGPKPSSSHPPSPLLDKKPPCVSASSHLIRLLSAELHLPCSGRQGLAEKQRRRGLSSCDAPPSSGLSTSTQHIKEKRCSGIPEFSAGIFRTSCELEKENAHFIVVDMMLEVLEAVKWTLSSDGGTSTADTHQHTLCDASSADEQRCNTQTPYRKTHSYTHTRRHTQEEEAGNEHPPKTFSVLSTDSGFEDSGVDATLTPRDSLRNAESLAQQLVLEFRRSWIPSHEPQRGRQSLRSSLQELPGTGEVAESSDSLVEEIRLRTRMRGSLSWAPPRFQIIFTVQPTQRRSEVVTLQHFLCAGCGTKVEPRYIKKLRYCDYLGRYFCDCCHGGSEAVIPGRILSCWDFGRYPVSDFSKQLLESVWHQPLFDLTCVGKTLSSKVKELDKFRELQEQLTEIKKLLSACRLSAELMSEFEQLPVHLTEPPYLFSMDDLLRVKKGQLVARARALLHSAVQHVNECQLCLARGFICEFCRQRDIIFPFQKDICRRCAVCRACFHKSCFVEKKCPKCARIRTRKKTSR